jgi:outer membrane biosynthesis protein TonB
MTTNRTLLIVAALAGVMCTQGIASAAKKRVVVLDVEGARNKNLERSLSDLVGEEAKVLPSTDYRKLAKKLKATKLSPDHVAKVAAKLEADGVLESLIIAEGGRYTLRLRLREGGSGRTIKKIALKLRAPELSGKMEDALADRLLGAIADLPPLETMEEMDGDPEEEAAETVKKVKKPKREPMIEDDEAEVEDEPPPPPKKVKKAAKAKPRRVASADDEEDMSSALEVSDPNEDERVADAEEDEDAEAEDDDEEPAAEVASSSRRAVPLGDGAAVAAGLGVIKRKLAFNSRADMMNAPTGYAGGAVPAVMLDGEVYPMALAGKAGALANLGIGFAAHKGIGLKTNVLVDDMPVALPTDETMYGIDVRYRHKIGGKMSLLGSMGYSRLQFVIDRTAAQVDVPNTNYRYLRPGVELRYAATRRVTLAADAQLFLIRSSGAIGSAEEYGQAKMTGGEGGAGLEMLWGKRLITRVGARLTLMAYQFQGNGLQTTDRDGDPASVDVGGALDQYIQADLTAGYIF